MLYHELNNNYSGYFWLLTAGLMMIILISELIYVILFQRNIFEEAVMPPVKSKVLHPELTLFNRTQNFLFMITTKCTIP